MNGQSTTERKFLILSLCPNSSFLMCNHFLCFFFLLLAGRTSGLMLIMLILMMPVVVSTALLESDSLLNTRGGHAGCTLLTP